MTIVTVRRISQIFFFLIFIWFCVAATFGIHWWQLRGWPVNLFLQLDPLVALGAIFTTHRLYAPLLWALLTIILTIIFGRFFCSWVCPFGSLHHFMGFLGSRGRKLPDLVQRNKYKKAQAVKYYILIVFLIMALVPLEGTTLLTGLLDPIPLVTRSINLVLLPIVDGLTHAVWDTDKFFQGAWLILSVFIAALFLNFLIPRFYCRFLCPLGALFGIVSRFALWRIGKNSPRCPACQLCEKFCEGGCEPAENIRISECVLCFNCLDTCQHDFISYQTAPSATGEITHPDLSRRGAILALAGSIIAVPALRLSRRLGANYYYNLIRPPGSLPEEQFLQRCIKCGQCMRICPTNVLQPAGLEFGLESFWTPILNNRIGSSGCQLNCVACSQICPTAAIRPITLVEKLGINEFTDQGPIKIGAAFVDHGRCLPWTMDRPCIVCQENCPVSPKAIYTRQFFSPVRDGSFKIIHADKTTLQIPDNSLKTGAYSTGDYYCLISTLPQTPPAKILANTGNSLTIASSQAWSADLTHATVQIQVRLQRPYVDIDKCIGCGICQHECPVSGLRAIRVTAEGQTRDSRRPLKA